MNGIVLVDKPVGPTSFEVVRLVRHAAREKSAGHTGTLDPMASGLLVVCLGEATKLVPYLMDTRKRYLGIAALGTATDTDDAQGSAVEHAPVPTLDPLRVDAVAARFVGRISQVPPVYAALKQDGEALYRKARRGEKVQVNERFVEIHALRLSVISSTEIGIDVTCGKGTYVRSLARDLARSLGTVGHLSMLRRLETSGFHIEQACDLDTVQRAKSGQAPLPVLPPDAALAHLRSVVLDPPAQERIRHGRPCAVQDALPFLPGEKLALRRADGALLAVGRAVDETVVTSERWLHLHAVAH